MTRLLRLTCFVAGFRSICLVLAVPLMLVTGVPSARAQEEAAPIVVEPAVNDAEESAQATSPEIDGAVVVAEEPATDIVAQAYMMKCAGCHTIGGGDISGPDLKKVATWPLATLVEAVKRMEKNVGPLSDEESTAYAEFLLGEDVAARLAEEQQRIAHQQAASLDAANAELGAKLFFGKRPFARKGVSCSACHQAGGKGGNLAASLEDAFTRIGEMPLIATCESPGYPVMRSIYADRGLTKQEAIHVVKFLESVSEEPAKATTIPLHLFGMFGAAGILYAVSRGYKHRLQGTRANMVAQAHRKFNHGNTTGSKG